MKARLLCYAGALASTILFATFSQFYIPDVPSPTPALTASDVQAFRVQLQTQTGATYLPHTNNALLQPHSARQQLWVSS